MKALFSCLLFLFSAVFFPLYAQYQAAKMGNPLIPGYFADPTVKKFGDTYYIYATTDGNGGGFGPSQVWISKDFVNWSLQDMNWPTTHHYWAPDATLGPDGKYYLYYCQPVEIFGASSNTPVGPWTSLLPPGKPIVPNHLVANVITLDGQTFKDDDGKYYMYWGTWGIYPKHGCGVGLLNPDMRSFAKLDQIPNTAIKDFFEAPFVFKRNGIYYLTYSSGFCEDGTYRVQYATSKTGPMGPFIYGANNPILATNADGTVHGPGHQSVLQEGDDFYLVYHRHNNPHAGGGYHRQVAADRLIFDQDGNIMKLEPTHNGIGFLGKNANPHPNHALRKKVTASSTYDNDFKAEFALDDNNGTLWKPKNNVGQAWLQVDLGKTINVKNVHTQFEYATWYYQYRIDYSLNGKTWKTFADRTKNMQHGSPMVDLGNVNARYLRITIMNTEYPGLNKAIWNFKVFDNAEYQPAMPQPKQRYVSTGHGQPKGLLVNLNAAQLDLGVSVKSWVNTGGLKGSFVAQSGTPITTMIEGKKGVVFTGKETLKADVQTPNSLLGNSSYSVSLWVLNPEIASEETLLSWTKGGGDILTNVAIGFGAHKKAGAVKHLGWGDMGFSKLPTANQWHHLVLVFDGTMERLYIDGKLDREERKMLFIKELNHLLLGNNTEGSAAFSGALASLQLYDVPLDSTAVASLFKKGTPDQVALYATAEALNEGKVKEWANQGYASGALKATNTLTVSRVSGKIAVGIGPLEQLKLNEQARRKINFSHPFTFVATVFTPNGSETKFNFGGLKSTAHIKGAGKWQQVIATLENNQLRIFTDGKLMKTVNHADDLSSSGFSVSSSPQSGTGSFISDVTIHNFSFDGTQVIKEYHRWKETLLTHEETASFIDGPAAITPNMVSIQAKRPNLPGQHIKYLFQKNGKGVDWVSSPKWVDTEVDANQQYSYTVSAKDNFGNITGVSAASKVKTHESLFEITTQTKDADANLLQKDGLAKTIWDGLIGKTDTAIQHDGILRLTSNHTAWDGASNVGPFAFKQIIGDFTVQVKLADIIGLKENLAVGANEAGLMVRSATDGKKLIQNGVMLGWGVGNITTNLGVAGRIQFNNSAGFKFYRYLQIQKSANLFFLRGSTDAKNWIELPGSPIQRDDLGKSLEVGVYHATYGDQKGFAVFSEFKLFKKTLK